MKGVGVCTGVAVERGRTRSGSVTSAEAVFSGEREAAEVSQNNPTRTTMTAATAARGSHLVTPDRESEATLITFLVQGSQYITRGRDYRIFARLSLPREQYRIVKPVAVD